MGASIWMSPNGCRVYLFERKLNVKETALHFLYKESLIKLEKKIRELGKEVDITTLIIDMIEDERVLTIEEKRSKILLLDHAKER